jgi:NAD(P)H-hydrate repair Nnr-like enzyme with NAD(P)H-hydrate dehydratase domain
MVGAAMAYGLNAWEAASVAVYRHGLAAEAECQWDKVLPASELLKVA